MCFGGGDGGDGLLCVEQEVIVLNPVVMKISKGRQLVVALVPVGSQVQVQPMVVSETQPFSLSSMTYWLPRLSYLNKGKQTFKKENQHRPFMI